MQRGGAEEELVDPQAPESESTTEAGRKEKTEWEQQVNRVDRLDLLLARLPLQPNFVNDLHDCDPVLVREQNGFVHYGEGRRPPRRARFRERRPAPLDDDYEGRDGSHENTGQTNKHH